MHCRSLAFVNRSLHSSLWDLGGFLYWCCVVHGKLDLGILQKLSQKYISSTGMEEICPYYWTCH